jgi:biotin carboxylase
LQGVPAVLLLDPGREGINFKSQSAQRGLAVISVYTTPREHIATRGPNVTAGDAASIFTSDVDEILEEILKLGADVVGVVPVPDVAVHTADMLAAKLNLPGNGAELALARRNKAAMRETAALAGLRIPRFALVKDVQDIAAAAATVGFPAIVKQTVSAGSHGTRLLSCSEDADDNSTLLTLDYYGRPVEAWLVEQYVRGRELAVNCFSYQGKHQVVDIWEYRQPGEQDYSFPYWESAQIPQDDPDWQKAVDYVHQVLSAFGVTLGPSHTEVKVFEGEVYLMEIAARLPGGPMIDQWIAHSNLDPMQQALDCRLGKRPAFLDIPVRFDSFCGASAIRNDGPAGVLTEIRGLEDLAGTPGIDKVLLTYKVGDLVPTTDSVRNIPVGVWVSASDYATLVERLAHVRDTVELVIEPVEGLR